MRKWLLLLLLSINGLWGLAQNPDSVLAVFREMSVEEQAEQLGDFSRPYWFSQPELAKKLALQGIRAAREVGKPKWEYRNLTVLGIHYQYQPNPDSAEYLYSLVLADYDKYQDSLVYAKALSNLGLLEQSAGNQEAAMEKMLTALGIYKTYDTAAYQSSLLNVGNSFIRMGDMDNARQYVGDCIRLTGRSGDSASLSNALNSYGIIMEIENKYDSALIYYHRSADVKLAVGNLRGLLSSYTNLGNMFSRYLKVPDSAAYYYDLGLELARELGYSDKEGELLTNSGNELENAGRYREAADRHARALKLAQEADDYEVQINSQWSLAMVKGKYLGEEAEAFELLRQNRHLRDSVYRREKLEAIEELNLKYETAETERELAQTREQLAERQLYITLLIAAALVILLGGLLWVARERARRRQVLFEAQEKGLQAVIQATEEERRRIARDLHDGIGQELGSLMLAFDQLQVQVEGSRESLKDRLATSISQVRTLSHQMMPRALELAGLAPALEELVQHTFGSTEIDAEYDAFRVPDELDAQVSLVAYRVAQELISNVIRHAEATEVSVQLTANADNLTLTVEDNGRGFVPDPAAPGIGLTNMRTRLQQVNGSLQYESGEGGGTRALVRIPLKEAK